MVGITYRKTKKEEEERFEVERVIDYMWCKKRHERLYLVKWVGYDESENTWEPFQYLDCPDKIKDFNSRRINERKSIGPRRKRFLEVNSNPLVNLKRHYEQIIEICPTPTTMQIESFHKKMKKKKIEAWDPSKLETQLGIVSRRNGKDNPRNKEAVSEIKEQIMLYHVKDVKTKQLRRLREWEDEINLIDSSTSSKVRNAKLIVENHYDLKTPRPLTYINLNKPSINITIPDSSPTWCKCSPQGGCSIKSEKKCCPSNYSEKVAYNLQGQVRIELGSAIYECNKKCKCDSTCTNRIIQNGRKYRLSIFRTSNGCGWGVKTLENIKKGTFVLEYVGEVITSEEAERRGKKYDAEEQTYLFDLDYHMGDKNPYTIDAAMLGNVGSFVNHSCEPNLLIYNVWVDCVDPNLPRLCMFASRNIDKHEELTFDYVQTVDPSISPKTKKTQHKNWHDAGEAKSTTCRCGATKCRKTLF